MPKIRGIKPDYWTDEDIVELSIPARLLFIGLWNYACDNGHLPDKPKQIKMRIFPGDDIDVPQLLDELADMGRVDRDNGTITIPNFAHHQKPHHRWWSTCDLPECVNPHRPTTVDNTPPKRTRNRGQRVATGGNEKQQAATAVVDVDGDVEGDGEGERNKTLAQPQAVERLTKPTDLDFDKFWDAYPRRVGKGQARKAWKTAAKKTEPDTIIAAASAFTARAGNQDPKFIPHPATWLNGERWTDEPDPDYTTKSQKQAATDDLFSRSMARAIERDNGQWAINQ